MADEIWTLSEQNENGLKDISFELLAWGRKLADERQTALCAVVLANEINDSELINLFEHGADKVYVVQNKVFTHFLVEPQARTLKYLVETFQPETILAGATSSGRTVMPYLAMKLHTGLTADCTGLEIESESGNLLQIRPAIGGNIMATIKTPNHRPQLATVRPKSIIKLEPRIGHVGEIVKPDISEDMFASRIRFEKNTSESRSNAALEEADIVVSGGLGLQGPESFEMISDLADLMGAAIGSSRPPVDHGWQPYVRQVGLSGRTISPTLYIAVGISGAVQHLAGIQTAKNIIAINTDPEAPIFKVADFGIVGDAEKILPTLMRHLQEDL
jgi:electron transfer flavoprotein alpha subunit